MAFDLDAALHDAVGLSASDLHVKVPSAPRVRVGGELVSLDGYEPVTAADTEELTRKVLRSDHKHEEFERRGSADVSYYTADGRFRASVFRQRGSVSFIFRVIPEAPEPEGLRIPDVVLSWARRHRGLVIVGGATGSGKSTTTAVLIRLVNQERNCHVVTIEDPIEFLHSDQEALVTQREVGTDAPDALFALRSALRQDPDVMLIGEVRDEETAMTALRAAETGHLVMCTLHTIGAAESLQRFLDLFSHHNPQLARKMLAETLIGVVNQRLIPAQAGSLVLNPEVLVATARVRELIQEGAPTRMLQQAMAEGEYYGMHSFDQDLVHKVREGVIDRDVAQSFAVTPQDFRLMIEGAIGSGRLEDPALAQLHPQYQR